MTNNINTNNVTEAIQNVKKALTVTSALSLQEADIQQVADECRDMLYAQQNPHATFRSLFAGRVATQAAFQALKAFKNLQVNRIGTTDILVVDGVKIRVHAVCNNGCYVLADPQNAVPVDAVMGVRVRMKGAPDSPEVEGLSYIGSWPWSQVAQQDNYRCQGARLSLPKTKRYPEGGSFTLHDDCYAIDLEYLAA